MREPIVKYMAISIKIKPISLTQKKCSSYKNQNMNNSADKNKTTARNFYEGYNDHDLASLFEKYISHDLINHTLGGAFGRQGWLDYDIAVISAVPDFKITVLEQIAEGNKVVTRWKSEGTHTKPFFDKDATGNNIGGEGVSIDVIENDKIIEHNFITDFTKVGEQFNKK